MDSRHFAPARHIAGTIDNDKGTYRSQGLQGPHLASFFIKLERSAVIPCIIGLYDHSIVSEGRQNRTERTSIGCLRRGDAISIVFEAKAAPQSTPRREAVMKRHSVRR